MKKLIFTLIAITLSTTACFAQLTPQETAKIRDYVAKQKGVTEANLDKELQKDAVTKILKAEKDEAVERIRRKKIDEAKTYVPTEAEIVAFIQAKIDAQE